MQSKKSLLRSACPQFSKPVGDDRNVKQPIAGLTVRHFLFLKVHEMGITCVPLYLWLVPPSPPPPPSAPHTPICATQGSLAQTDM